MTRIPPVTPDTATPQQLADYNELAKSHAVSNMKAALLHSPVALDAVLTLLCDDDADPVAARVDDSTLNIVGNVGVNVAAK